MLTWEEELEADPRSGAPTCPGWPTSAGSCWPSTSQTRGSNGYSTYAEQASKTAQQVADSDSVAIAIRERITTPWTGTAGELLAKLTSDSRPRAGRRPPRAWVGG